jgi:hypothetical protein
MGNFDVIREAFIEGYKRGFKKGVTSVKEEVGRVGMYRYKVGEELLYDEVQDYMENFVDNDNEPNCLIYGMNF